jgi:hypothetical protein
MSGAAKGLGKSAFGKAEFGRFLAANVSPKQFGEGKCAKHLRLALMSAGCAMTTWPVSAKDWGPKLEALGFAAQPAGTVPQAGDVAVIQPPAGHEHGHIQGYDGASWISDFRQKEFWPGPEYRKEKPPFLLYRR